MSPLEPEAVRDAVRRLYEVEGGRMRERFDRSLPLDEVVFDRWERARELGFGEGASIYHRSYVFGDVSVGEGTWIGPYTLLDGSGGLEIGAWCSISSGVQVYSHDTVRWALTMGRAPYERAPVTIGDGCFLGPYAVVAAGVAIGRRCVVGAHAYVNRSLPDDSIAVGVPARVVGRVVDDGDGGVAFRYD